MIRWSSNGYYFSGTNELGWIYRPDLSRWKIISKNVIKIKNLRKVTKLETAYYNLYKKLQQTKFDYHLKALSGN